MKWISVEERLPELNQGVLIYFKGYITGGHIIKVDHLIKYHNNPAEWKYTQGLSKITHWMPLPEPPKV